MNIRHPFPNRALALWVAFCLSGAASHAWLPPLELVSPNEAWGGLFGSGVSGIPDVNGDGMGDVVVGARNEGGGYLELGHAYVLDGATGRVLHSFSSPNARQNGSFGRAVSGLADVNGDGLGDVVVGERGAAYVYDGSNGSLLYKPDAPTGSRGFPRSSISGISDVNGDGRGDIVFGATARAYVFDGATGQVLRTLASPNEQEEGGFGGPVSAVPDVNGDGCEDIIVGATGEGPETSFGRHAGRAYIFDGADGSLLHALLPPEEPEFSPFGSRLAGIPDLSGDGRGDVAVSASWGPEGMGRVYVFDGANGALLFTLTSPSSLNPVTGRAGDWFGESVCGLADVNGDGLGDVAVGEGGEAIYIFDGATGLVLHWLLAPNRASGGDPVSTFGGALAAVPDANGDGRPELIAGDWTTSSGSSPRAAGRAFVYYLGPETITTLIESFYWLVLGRAPEKGAVQTWETGYFQYAVAMDVDVRFVPREMGRLFFLSDEYTSRSRTNEQFITNCYWAFLDRDPRQSELDNWVGTGDGQTTPTWNRSEVMTIFAESEEFAARITKMYPDKPGAPSKNFVTTMYVGLLDRLADSAGLECAASLFDAAKAQGSIEACRTQAKQTAREILASDEFQNLIDSAIPNPHSAIVARLYRAFLGRFPADHEEAYWTGELDAGRTTTDAMIDLFAAAPEFAERLRLYFEAP